jgi:hypothetical protein
VRGANHQCVHCLQHKHMATTDRQTCQK